MTLLWPAVADVAIALTVNTVPVVAWIRTFFTGLDSRICCAAGNHAPKWANLRFRTRWRASTYRLSS